MGQIRKQVIYSSLVIYIGFAVGFLNTYFFVRNGTFTTEQYGLTRLMSDMAITFFSFTTLGTLSYIYKFFPYYKANLEPRRNDQLTWSLVISLTGFVLLTIAAILFQPLIVRKFSERSALLVHYYYWILPFTFGVLVFSIFEAFAWFEQQSIFTNFLKELGLRLFQTVLLVLFIAGSMGFGPFIKLYSLGYLLIAFVLVVYMRRKKSIRINFTPSKVTRRLSTKVIPYMGLIYGSHVINTLAQYIDGIIIASVSVKGLADAGIYTLAAFIANTIQVPQRSIVSAAVPVLSHSWRERNLGEINRIYHRSSINLLLLSLFIFFVIWMNIQEVFTLMNVNKDYEAGYIVILILGIGKIIDAGTGVNSQIIGTSNYWKFDVLTGIVLLVFTIPLNYFLVKSMGIKGSAIANLISFSVYNALRLGFIWKKFNMQPFTWKSLYAVLVALGAYLITTQLLGGMQGMVGIFVKSALFTLLFAGTAYWLQITPDAHQLVHVLRQRLDRRRGR